MTNIHYLFICFFILSVAWTLVHSPLALMGNPSISTFQLRVCGASFAVEHTQSAHSGICDIRGLTANLFAEVCLEVSTEPHLQTLNGEDL